MAATRISKVEPVNGTSSFRSSGSRSRGFDTPDLLSDKKVIYLVKIESRNTSRVKKVVTKVRDILMQALHLERLLLGERVGKGSAAATVAIQRDFLPVEDIRRKGSPFPRCQG